MLIALTQKVSESEEGSVKIRRLSSKIKWLDMGKSLRLHMYIAASDVLKDFTCISLVNYEDSRAYEAASKDMDQKNLRFESEEGWHVLWYLL